MQPRSSVLVPRPIFITGGTGYIGSRLTANLVARGHYVRAIVRAQSASRVPAGAEAVIGNALDADDIAKSLRPGDTLVQLLGTPHPGPGATKAAEFQRVDLVSVRASVAAARRIEVGHFVYVSVAHPAPVMKAYQAVRMEGEALIADAALTATVLRPWYVVGPGHWWPVILLPIYGIAKLVPAAREGAARTSLITLSQMLRALVAAVEDPPPSGTRRVLDVPHIRLMKS